MPEPKVFGITIIDPESDEGKYRITCYHYIMGNPEKFPEIHSFLDMERESGTIFESLTMLGQVISNSFHRNESIAECARLLEELHKRGRIEAEKIYDEYIKWTEKGTIH